MPEITSAQLQAAIDGLQGAAASGNMAAFQEKLREFNLSYANDVAQLYGQNFGPGNPAPIGAATLAAGQATGGIGYIPGFTGVDAGQTMAQLQGAAGTAQSAAGLTGWYAAPQQSQYSPGTFVRLDPSTYDTGQYGTQISYVLPSGQLQRVSTDQARAMGWNGNLDQMTTIPAQTALQLEHAPPSQLPQQTIQGLTAYSNLNAAAQNAAIAQSGVTGMYQAPQAIQPPGTNMSGGKFSDLDPGTQQAYYLSRGSDWNAAMQAWVNDSNSAIRQSIVAAGGNPDLPGGAGPQETLAAQQQYFAQANALASQFGQYYAPGAPGQAGQAGVNMPAPGQQTQSMQEQMYRQQLDAINAAAALQANPFRQAQVIGQLGGVLSGQGAAGFAAPNTTNQTNFSGMGNMQQLINDINARGVRTGTPQTAAQWLPQGAGQQPGQAGQLFAGGAGPAGASVAPNWGQAPSGGSIQQTIDDIRGGTNGANSYDPNNVLNAIPTPNKLDSVNFYRSSPGTQNMILQGMQEKYGLAPAESLSQIKNTLPAFQAPTTFGSIKG